MPQDPRHGDFGHRRTRPDEDADANGSASGSGRRRRALSEDGTGGTRVIDLLSKHGKGPNTSGHRRAAEPEQPSAPQSPQKPPQTGPRRAAPPAPPEPPQAWTSPEPSGRRPRQAPPSRPMPTPPAPPNNPAPPAGWTAPGTGPRPTQQPPARPVSPPSGRNQRPTPPPAAPGAAAAFAGGAAARPARRNPEPPGEEATRISQALGADTPQRVSPPSGRNPRPNPSPSPSRPPADMDATTQHPRVPAAPRPEQPARPAKPAAAAPAQPAKPTPPPVERAEETAIVAPADGYSELDEFDDEVEVGGQAVDDGERQNDIEQIDLTLARFSAVHDEIAAEEAKRRKRYAWLPGNKKEPELGSDMPFDFHDDRGGASRMEWKKKQRKRRTHLIVMAVAVAASLTVFLSLGFAWGATTLFGPPAVLALDPNSSDIKDVAGQAGDQNFLMIGSDTRAGASAADGVGSEADEPGARSDTTMIAHIPADRSRVVMVSFPRDLQVDRPSCQRWDSTTGKYSNEVVPAKKGARLNEAYAVGGPLCTTKVIQQVSGLRMDSFLGIDFNGFKSMVDAVHGVEISTDKPIVDETLGTVIPEAGQHTLTGDQALTYVRARHVKGDPTSDYGRMERQQTFLSSLLHKTMSSQVLLDPRKLSDFVKAVGANTFGDNVGADRLMGLGQQLQGLDPNKVSFMTVPTTGYANDEGMEVLREDATKSLFQSMIDGRPVTTDATPQKAAQSTPSGGPGGP
ncbi:LCP family protein [Saccharopolyspora dendranthemae]|uniref:LytR family transcriptional attenuator n=1 Tax=Saccharopolyspora dendranthemae TaxID=1181886 RepID=A0A561U646_9PSEU|nr:LCP family protein [Saccharopolyspora dendranthemae]TWF94816.1 LytR family transcriptional attenuator [Saccharopolyspora dendranthemae]